MPVICPKRNVPLVHEQFLENAYNITFVLRFSPCFLKTKTLIAQVIREHFVFNQKQTRWPVTGLAAHRGAFTETWLPKTPDGLLWWLDQTLSRPLPGHQGHAIPPSCCYLSPLHPSVCIYITHLLPLLLSVLTVVGATVKCILTGAHAATDASSTAANVVDHHFCYVCVCSILAVSLTHLVCKWSAIALVFEW